MRMKSFINSLTGKTRLVAFLRSKWCWQPFVAAVVLCQGGMPQLLPSVVSVGQARAEVVTLDRVVAVVNDNIVMHSDLDARVEHINKKLQKSNRPLPPTKVLEQQVLEQLIMEELQLQLAARAGARIDDHALNSAVVEIAKKNGMTVAQFQQSLKNEGLSYSDVREQIRREMLIERVRRQQVLQKVHISAREIENFKQSAQGQQALQVSYRLEHRLFPLPAEPTADQIQKARQEAEKLYRAHADSAANSAKRLGGTDLGWRTAEQLPSLFVDSVPQLQVGMVARPLQSSSGFHVIKLTDRRGGDTVVQQQYKVRHILIKPNQVRSDLNAMELAQNLYQRLAKGANFAELAKAYSDDPGSALNGGDLGWVSPDSMVPTFRDTMKSAPARLPSKPFKSRFGWHILQVEGTREEDVSTKVRDERIREMLAARKYEESLKTWLAGLRARAYVSIK